MSAPQVTAVPGAKVGSAPARAEIRQQGGGLLVVLGGDWRLEPGVPRFESLLEAAPARTVPGGAVRAVRFDAGTLGG